MNFFDRFEQFIYGMFLFMASSLIVLFALFWYVVAIITYCLTRGVHS